MLLARQGHRVLVVDRATFPSDTNSTHYVQQPAAAKLRDWGLLDEVVATGCPPVPIFGLDVGDAALRGHPTPADGQALAYGPRRYLLDTILVEAAAEAGATVETGCTVEDLLVEDGVVCGVRARDDTGATITERARLVVGADGLRSRVARLVDAPMLDDRGVLHAGWYAYWHGIDVPGMEAFVRGEEKCAAIPTNDGLTCIPVVFPARRFDEVHADVEGHYLAVLDQTPLGEQARAGGREGRWHAAGPLPNHLRQPVGPGWALVGDAGIHHDPITAHGITHAFVGAQQLADAVGPALAGETSMDDALTAYHRARDEDVLPMLDLTCTVAAPGPFPPEMVALLKAMDGNTEATDRWFGVLAGTVHPAEFMAPENLSAIFAAAAERGVEVPTPTG
jgi:2-polyprenyl-6-methoxyphenol hydroxylase-like FAD-dependent oxidoreductase